MTELQTYRESKIVGKQAILISICLKISPFSQFQSCFRDKFQGLHQYRAPGTAIAMKEALFQETA